MTESIIQHKFCSSCRETKTSEHFSKAKARKDGLNSFCKPCQKEYFKKWKKTPKGKASMKGALLKMNFGITLNDYNEMFDQQNGVCAICKTHTTEHKLHVDHCHSTDKIRGLLCARCNTALGLFKDSIEFLQSAIEYLKKQSN